METIRMRLKMPVCDAEYAEPNPGTPGLQGGWGLALFWAPRPDTSGGHLSHGTGHKSHTCFLLSLLDFDKVLFPAAFCFEIIPGLHKSCKIKNSCNPSFVGFPNVFTSDRICSLFSCLFCSLPSSFHKTSWPRRMSLDFTSFSASFRDWPVTAVCLAQG